MRLTAENPEDMKGEYMKGYKVFNPDWTCKGFKYEVGKKYHCDGKISCCKNGFHFCTKLADCFNYYEFNSNNKVAEIEASGDIDSEEDDTKHCASDIEIIREITWHEVLDVVNEGKDNTGMCNTGDCNTGNRNTGCRNTGDCNTGDCNTGNRNSGNFNSGNRNSGNRNSGNRNSGNRNSGNRNSGDFNSGDFNSGNRNSGDFNSGNFNSGNRNSGNRNSGDFNSGNFNSGDFNSGNFNSGNRNTGDRNTGDCNTGDCNTGNFNSGNFNSGDFNKADRCTGVFCTENEPFRMFNKPTDWTYEDWRRSRAFDLLYWDLPRLETVEWISADSISDNEKKAHPDYEVTGGYLKVLNIKESNQVWWESLSESDKKAILSLPNFDKAIFEDVLGIKIGNEEVGNE